MHGIRWKLPWKVDGSFHGSSGKIRYKYSTERGENYTENFIEAYRRLPWKFDLLPWKLYQVVTTTYKSGRSCSRPLLILHYCRLLSKQVSPSTETYCQECFRTANQRSTATYCCRFFPKHTKQAEASGRVLGKGEKAQLHFPKY